MSPTSSKGLTANPLSNLTDDDTSQYTDDSERGRTGSCVTSAFPSEIFDTSSFKAPTPKRNWQNLPSNVVRRIFDHIELPIPQMGQLSAHSPLSTVSMSDFFNAAAVCSVWHRAAVSRKEAWSIVVVRSNAPRGRHIEQVRRHLWRSHPLPLYICILWYDLDTWSELNHQVSAVIFDALASRAGRWRYLEVGAFGGTPRSLSKVWETPALALEDFILYDGRPPSGRGDLDDERESLFSSAPNLKRYMYCGFLNLRPAASRELSHHPTLIVITGAGDILCHGMEHAAATSQMLHVRVRIRSLDQKTPTGSNILEYDCVILPAADSTDFAIYVDENQFPACLAFFCGPHLRSLRLSATLLLDEHTKSILQASGESIVSLRLWDNVTLRHLSSLEGLTNLEKISFCPSAPGLSYTVSSAFFKAILLKGLFKKLRLIVLTDRGEFAAGDYSGFLELVDKRNALRPCADTLDSSAPVRINAVVKAGNAPSWLEAEVRRSFYAQGCD